MPEEPPIAPDPVIIPGQDAPDPQAPPEVGPDVPPVEIPDNPGDGGLRG
jgi:hypothetical protein